MIHSTWRRKPRLSVAFWLALLSVYVLALLGVISLSDPVVGNFLKDANAPELAYLKITYFRIPMILIFISVFPILLFRSLAQAFLFIRIITAVAIVIYIDDHLVLYKYLEQPERLAVRVALFLRPVSIMSLLWMTFELHHRVKLGQSQ
jgi:hypothetical protein